MYRKILISGATAAAIIGVGGTALAVSGSDTTSGTPSGSSSSAGTHAGKHAGKSSGKHATGRTKLLKNLSHAQIVAKGKDGAFVTHDLINGTVTAVSATSISVQAADKTTETFAVSTTTVVRQRTSAKAKGTPSSISKIVKGDHVLVAGTGTSHLAARRVLELPK